VGCGAAMTREGPVDLRSAEQVSDSEPVCSVVFLFFSVLNSFG